MTDQFNRKSLRHIEISAYIIALWSVGVLFFESLIGFYLNYSLVENVTAVANIALLLLTIVTRLLSEDVAGSRKIIIFDLIMLVLGSLLMIYQAKFVIFILLIRQTYFIIQYMIFKAFEGKLYRFMSGNPPVTLMLSFLVVILIGSIFLMLPTASAQNRVTGFQDALFTATSATCVTGLIVLDTGTHWSTFGQLVILFLIQVGGLGIMTVSTAFALILGQRLTLKIENIMYNVVGSNSQINVFRLLKNIVMVTFIIEAIGAALLFVTFRADYEPVRALYLSFFHSVSAFCNAGFSLFSDSFISYASNPLVNVSLTVLIIIGGLGFTVIIDLYRFFFGKDKTRRLSLHSKMVLVISSGLLILGFGGYFVSEYFYTMSGFSWSERILGSWFQSVTTRTAGFNTIDTSQMSSASILLSFVLMFVGASPGSTGGGIKTTTFGVLILTVSSLLQGKKNLTVFNRKLAWSNFRESVSVISVSVFIVFTVIFLLLLIEPFQFQEVVFESISAFGTVGLSLGITSELSTIGKVLISLLMYLGRIGPLTLIYAFAIKRENRRIDYAEEKLAIG